MSRDCQFLSQIVTRLLPSADKVTASVKNAGVLFPNSFIMCIFVTIMSDFIVSARKYRPATFSSVVGQQHITSTLRNAIERGQLAHAYLFCGPRGVGKTTCARIFAKAINCMHPVGAEACNECESCRAFNEGRSLNIHELDAASNNSVEDIRTLIEQVRILPQSGRYSVFIIDEVHMLSSNAFNAFLKTLEEPPAHAVFILATTEKHKIIPTILSRCQIYDFNRIRVEDVVGYLGEIARKEGITSDEESLNLIAQKADGGMRDALSMFDKAVSFCGTTLEYKNVARTLNVLDYDTYFDITRMLVEGRYVDALVAFDDVLSRGFSDQIFMAGLNHHMRDLLMAQDVNTLKLIEITGTLMERYRTQASACTAGFLFGAISILTELDGRIRQSSNRRLLVELGLMKIAGLGQKKNEVNPLFSIDAPLPDPAAPKVARPQQPVRPTSAPTPASAPQTAPRPASAASAAQTAPKAVSAEPRPAVKPSISVRITKDIASAEPVHNDTPVAQPAEVKPAEKPTTTTPMPAEPEKVAAPVEKTAPVTTGQTSVSEVAPAPVAEPVATPEPKPARGRKPKAASSLFGTSLTELIAEAKQDTPSAETDAEGQPVATSGAVTDPESARKLDEARPKLMELIQTRRPRFLAAFELMKIDGNRITVSVPTTELHDEMMRTRNSMLRSFAEVAGINGVLDLEVKVNEKIRASRPIKLEDRLKYLSDKNSELGDFCKILDLNPE